MAKQPTPSLRPYEQQTAPQARGPTFARQVDVSSGASGIAASMARLGGAVENYQDTETQILRLQQQRREDDARVVVGRQMAEMRREASQLRRSVFKEAPDGWRGAVDTYAQRFEDLTARYASDPAIDTDEARALLDDEVFVFRQQALDAVAEEESDARQAWGVDQTNSTTDTLSGVINADPGQYEELRARHLLSIMDMSGISADQRRGLEERAEEQFALSAVAGIVERDPRAALAALRDPEAQGPYARLTGQQRDAYANRAQSELNRRESEARARQAQAVASLRDTVNAQVQLMQRGIMPSDPADVGVIARTLGPDVAQNYLANLAGVSASRSMSTMSSAQVAQVAGGSPSPQAGDLQNLLTVEARSAAQRVLRDREADPGGYALTNGLMRHGDLMQTMGQAVQAQDWAAFQQIFRERGADALELRRRGITPRIAVLSSGEASALGAWLQQQPAQARLGFFSQAAAAMDREAYTEMMRQIAPSGHVVAYAGARFTDNPDLARRLVRGSEILNPPPAPDGQRRATSPVAMPSDADMRRAWQDRVGRAYEGIPGAQSMAYDAFRAAYVARAEAAGESGGEFNDRIARSAIGDATGGITRWSGRETLMPPGFTRDDFEQGVASGFQQWSFLRDENPRDFDLIAVGGGRYLVDGLRNPVTGEPVQIQVRRPRQ